MENIYYTEVSAEEIEKRLTENLTLYLNDMVTNKGKLGHNQNLLEQIYIPKTETLY